MSQYLNCFDYDAVHAQAGEVIRNRKHLRKSTIERYLSYFNEKCKNSKEQFEQAKQVIPGGIQHNLANNYPFPLSISKAEGPFLYDVDGNRYYDLLMAGGPTILGNNYPTVRDACVEFIRENGPLTGLYSDYERKLAELVCHWFPSVEMFRMLGSGTEADIIGIRLARAYTQKQEIIRIRGGYHGWSDQLIYNANEAAPDAALLNGIPVDCFKHTRCIEPNDLEEAERLFEENETRGGTAAFVMEAIGQDSGALPTTPAFHKGIAALCRKYNALLIYDEVVTAFRLGMGGAQAIFGTKPDLTIFGKIMGGCYPCAGGIGGRAELLSMLAAGINGDRSKKVRVGGTLSANPLTAFAGYTTLKEMERLAIHAPMAKAADEFMHAIAALTEKYNVPALVFNHQSILHIDVAAAQHIPTFFRPGDPEGVRQSRDAAQSVCEFAMALAAEGVIISGGGKTYIGYQTISELESILAAYERVFREFE